MNTASQDAYTYLISDGEKTLLYAHDTGYFPDATWEYLKGRRLDCGSLDCTYGALPTHREGHMSLDVCADVAERLADKFGSKNVFDYIELPPDYAIYEIATPPSWCGKSILEKSVRTKYHISILAVKRGGKLSPLPSPAHIFSPEESLKVMGHHEAVRAVTK